MAARGVVWITFFAKDCFDDLIMFRLYERLDICKWMTPKLASFGMNFS
jgi:hypothetical protein